jgi:hypothetical protein
MVAASVSGTFGGAYAEAYCLQPNGYVTLPSVSSYGGSPTVDPITQVILSEASANFGGSFYFYEEIVEGCTQIDASARTKEGTYFSRTSEICQDGFDSALICIVGRTGGYTFECPDSSILAVSTMEPIEFFDDRISVTPKKASGLWGKVPSAVKLNIRGCISRYSSFGQFTETRCDGQLRYHFFHAPGSTMGLGYFNSEPCGSIELTDYGSFSGYCELGNSYPLSSASASLQYCNLVRTMPPLTAPTESPTGSPFSDGKSNDYSSTSSNALPRSEVHNNIIIPMLALVVVGFFVAYPLFL